MISKKDLLTKMNISYGQLYRWKREGLIPDEWFIKQSVASGQETFFEESLIIKRITKILELKDKYPLDKLKDFLSPDVSVRKYSARELIIVHDIDPSILREFSIVKSEFVIYEVCLLLVLSKHKNELQAQRYIDLDVLKIKSVHWDIFVIKDSDYYLLICDENTILDKDINIYAKYKIEDLINSFIKSYD